MLRDKKIIVGITGGIAAYKSAELIRQLREQGAEVRVVMTAAAKEFITPITLQALSANPVHDELLSREAEMAMGHIELARWADMIVVAPASADFIARLTYGHANDLLTTLCLATLADLYLAPAMNINMWNNPATQANIQTLTQRNIQLIGPACGIQACGDSGQGRMVEPEDIIAYFTEPTTKLLMNKRILITAGPTREALDPVRFISNHSSGKMGYALAEAGRSAGARVSLISGPVELIPPTVTKFTKVITADEMHQAVLAEITACDIFISVAAVADYKPLVCQQQKIKKEASTLLIELVKNPDILAAVAEVPNKPFMVGFAAETENLLANAYKKMADKKLDMIIANEVGLDKGFNKTHNKITILSRQGEAIELPEASKQKLATKIMAMIAEKLSAQ